MNSSFVEYMVFLKLLFTQNANFVSNNPIFPTGFFTLILLRVFVRVKIRVINKHIQYLVKRESRKNAGLSFLSW